MTYIGLIGGALLAICGIPLLLQAIKDPKTVAAISTPFLLMWCIGEWMTFSYYLFTLGLDIPTLLNYSINTAITTYLVWRKFR